jgi:hypothetical protein
MKSFAYILKGIIPALELRIDGKRSLQIQGRVDDDI